VPSRLFIVCVFIAKLVGSTFVRSVKSIFASTLNVFSSDFVGVFTDSLSLIFFMLRHSTLRNCKRAFLLGLHVMAIHYKMWPPRVLKDIGPILFHDASKVKIHFDAYVRTVLRPKWVSEVQSIGSLIDYRDYAEDTLSTGFREFISTDYRGPESIGIDNLVRALKMDPTKRPQIVVAYLEESFLILRLLKMPEAFVAFAIEQDLVDFFNVAQGIGRFRPLLKAPLEAIESVVAQMELTHDHSLDNFQKFSRDLGLQTLWPILALWQAHELGTVEETFLHPPLPRVFGAPSCVRNAIDRHGDPASVAKESRQPLNCKKPVVAGNGYVSILIDEWTTAAVKEAHLVANLPGMPYYVWLLDPTTLKAAIYKFDADKKTWVSIVEFDLPPDETAGQPNWIDCQRDSEGALVFLWGTINTLTGALYTQNFVAIDEDCLKGSVDFLASVASMPDRRKKGIRLDWRDHGNVLSVHHSVKDDPITSEQAARHWTHTYDIVYADTLLMTLTTDARPIEAIYGGPHELLLLSPLSASQGIQIWTLTKNEYTLKTSLVLPKCPKGHWASLCCAT